MKFNIGQKVKMSKDVAADLRWYNNETYTILNIDGNFLVLDKVIPIKCTNKIHQMYIMSLSELRKNKLMKLNEI
jgi:hypothetical protein